MSIYFLHNQQDCVDFKEKKVYNKLTRIQYRITTNYLSGGGDICEHLWTT